MTACQPASQQQHYTGMDSSLLSMQLAKAGGTSSGMQPRGALSFPPNSIAAASAVLPVTCLSLSSHQRTAPATFPLPPSSLPLPAPHSHTRGGPHW